jgi:hypothetical protein
LLHHTSLRYLYMTMERINGWKRIAILWLPGVKGDSVLSKI